ncbi:MAG TPA: N-6 DNA methylase, partial [Thermoanaerobaculia bacterium]|nr:N-6 DNA methylase [Thermoanaerobaculia bacterium]
EWILQNTRVLASIDLHPDLFQPSTSVQTSVLVLERKTESEIAVETAAKRKNVYGVFMALANHIGHDKRGNVLYVRDERGNEIIEERTEPVREVVDGRTVYRTQKTLRKVIDDNTEQIAQKFRKWLRERD